MIDVENAAPNVAPKAAKKGAKSIEQTYTKKTQLEHILLRPDTYVGSIDPHTQTMWVLDAATIVNRQVTFTPGLYKIFDEIIVNAADNKQRDQSMSKIEVNINPEEGSIRVWNNGNGIPVVMHSEHKVYVPELIFGHLLTGSNFDDDEEKTTGGRNGFGAKLANIFSTKFIVETSDSSSGLKYKQVFESNMTVKGQPSISKSSGSDYTCITFFPDLKRFKMDKLDEDTVALLSKRVYDIAGTNTAGGAKLNVHLNGHKVECKNFQTYIQKYQGLETPCVFERINDRWEIGVGISDGTFQQVSFANSIATSKGGTHVNYIADQISAKLMAPVKKKNKGTEVKAHQIKAHLAVYVNSLIVNPAFDSQTKENLTTKATQFGSKCVVSDKMLKTIEKSGIIDNILSWAKFKQAGELKKKSGAKKSKLIGIPKLDDANHAGTGKSQECTLILTEGDSAKALAISGLGVIGRDFYGVFPLKGKLLNVREAAHAQIMKNEEVQNIAKILGLTFGREYTDTSTLRYGHLMIMTDQDHDGSHIKGLLINFIHHFWPSLLKIPSFLQQFITPIVKCSKGKKEVTFFTIPEYTKWKDINSDGKGWTTKYYKGLGTSTSAEAKEYFSHLETHLIDFEWDDKANDVIDMAFAKKRVDDRKLWLLGLEAGVHIDYNVDSINYNEFINKELILFSHADNERSIPHFVDGLKPSQRKVLFACFKRNLRQEIKVAQLAGYVSEQAAYHHGEVSLTQTIIGMAQNFVGSNNINLLAPCGQFGTRLMGGKDAASPRYVFTRLENITRCIFHPHDDALLDYLEDDGQAIEPSFYVPVIPMALVNGSDGIGTGWSSAVPNYNPREIIANLRKMIAGEEPESMKPWYRGFNGNITSKSASQFTVAGNYECFGESTVIISELPVGKWVNDYKATLESWTIGSASVAAAGDDSKAVTPFIKDFKENHTDTTVKFTITVDPAQFPEMYHGLGGLQKKFKLDGSVATSNMHMFDGNAVIRKFETELDVLRSFYDVRIEHYVKRKAHLLSRMTEEWEKLDNKTRFILAVIDNKLVVSNRKKHELLSDLAKKGYKAFSDKKKKKDVQDAESDSEEIADEESPTATLEKGYDYLLSMKLWSLTMERVQALKNQAAEKRRELDTLLAKTPEDLWNEDLDALELSLDNFDAVFAEAELTESRARNKAVKNRAAGGGKKAKKSKTYDSDDISESEEEEEEYDSDAFARRKKAAAKKKPTKAAAKVAKELVLTEFVAPAVPAGFKVLQPRVVKPKDPNAKPVKRAPKSSAPSLTTTTVTLNDDSSDDEPQVLSLFERLKLSNQGSSSISAFSTGSSESFKAVAASKPKAKPTAVKKAPAAAKAAPARKRAASSDEDELNSESESEGEGEDAGPVKPRTPKPKRATAASKSYAQYAEDSEEEDEDMFSEEEEEEDYDSDAPKKKVPAPKTAAVAKKAPAAKKVPAAKKAAAAPVKKVAPAKKAAARKYDSEEDSEEEEPDMFSESGSDEYFSD